MSERIHEKVNIFIRPTPANKIKQNQTKSKRNVSLQFLFHRPLAIVVDGLHDGRHGRYPRQHGQSQNPRQVSRFTS